MRVIFLKQLKNTANAGDVKEVSDGYAFNFLFPNKIAEKATGENVKKLAAINKKKEANESVAKNAAEEIKKKLASKEITISVKAKNGKLFGSVGKKDIFEAIRKQGIDLDEKQAAIAETFKETGRKEFMIELHPQVKAKVILVIQEA